MQAVHPAVRERLLAPGLSLPLLIMRANLRPGGFPFSQSQLSKCLQWESHLMNITLSFWIVLSCLAILQRKGSRGLKSDSDLAAVYWISGFSALAAHWNHPGSFENTPPRDSGLVGLQCSLGMAIWGPKVQPMVGNYYI